MLSSPKEKNASSNPGNFKVLAVNLYCTNNLTNKIINTRRTVEVNSWFKE